MKFKVMWSKTYIASGFVIVEAKNWTQAERIAMENIGDYEGQWNTTQIRILSSAMRK